MRRLSNSWAMAKASWRVLQSDKELMAIPVMSFFATLAVAVLSGGAVFFSLAHHRVIEPGDSAYSATPMTYVVGAICYLLITFVVTFFAAALVAGARERLLGGNPTLGSAFAVAYDRLGPIFLWSMLAGTVGLILNTIQNRAGFLGQIIVRAIGMAWQIVTWLAVPVIVVEGTGPITSLKRSAGLFKQTWGENLIGQVGFGLIGTLAMLPGLALAFVVASAIPVAGIVLGVAWVAVVSVVTATLSGIFRTALYHFAVGEPVPPEFGQADLAGAFTTRKGRGSSNLDGRLS
jgi:hypothetical protein